MKKAIYILALSVLLVSCGKSETSSSDAVESIEPATTTVTVTTTQEPPVATLKTTTTTALDEQKTVYGVGETWIVKEQWELTITGIEETEQRNEFADKEPAAVYIVSYEYKNLGYVDNTGSADGLFISLENSVVDNAGVVGYAYPGEVTNHAQETPIGATCKAQCCIGVENAGDFKLNVTKYDGNEIKQTAIFDIPTNGISKITTTITTTTSESAIVTETTTPETTTVQTFNTEWYTRDYVTYPICHVDKVVYSAPTRESEQIGNISAGSTVISPGYANSDWLVIEWNGGIAFIEVYEVYEDVEVTNTMPETEPPETFTEPEIYTENPDEEWWAAE